MEQPSNENAPEPQHTKAHQGFDQAIDFGNNLNALCDLQDQDLTTHSPKLLYIDPPGYSLPQT